MDNSIILGGFIWAPAIKYKDEILEQLGQKYELLNYKKYSFVSFDHLERVIVKLYENDDVSMDYISNYKIKRLREYKPECINFCIKINNPKFSKAKHNNQMVINSIIKLKNKIRDKYKHEISDYKRDIIIHISDNQKQTNFVTDLLEKHIKKI